MRNRSGFTLLEILLAVTLTAIISLSVYSLFSSSVNVMIRMNQANADEDINIFCEKMGRDLENVVRYHPIPFVGKQDQFSFASPFLFGSHEGENKGVGQLTFLYDSSSESIQRRQDNLNQVYSEKLSKPITIFQHIINARFTYFAFDKNEKRYRWYEEYDETELPCAVRLQLEFLNGDKKIELTRTFFIPAGE